MGGFPNYLNLAAASGYCGHLVVQYYLVLGFNVFYVYIFVFLYLILNLQIVPSTWRPSSGPSPVIVIPQTSCGSPTSGHDFRGDLAPFTINRKLNNIKLNMKRGSYS